MVREGGSDGRASRRSVARGGVHGGAGEAHTTLMVFTLQPPLPRPPTYVPVACLRLLWPALVAAAGACRSAWCWGGRRGGWGQSC